MALKLFPYHLAEYVCRVMRVSPFRYYCDMIFEVMRNEQPYDSIPNFSAADALRLAGIGRNEFIDIMNKCKSKKIMWKLNKSMTKELLPTQPVDFPIESWWGVCLVNFTLEEFKKLSEEEVATIDKILYPEDRFKVSRLEGFVSNSEQSYEDPIEELLYAVFVVSNENASVARLATTVQADLLQLQAAASFVCRLGWATKVIDPSPILQDTSIHGSPRSAVSDEDVSLASHGVRNNLGNNAWTADDENLDAEDNHHQIRNEQQSIDELNKELGHLDVCMSMSGSLLGNANSSAARMGNHAFLPNARTGGHQFHSVGSESTSGQSPLRQRSPSPPSIDHSHLMENFDKQDHPYTRKNISFFGRSHFIAPNLLPPIVPMLSAALENYIKIATARLYPVAYPSGNARSPFNSVAINEPISTKQSLQCMKNCHLKRLF
ncbi:hypothetical protein KIW84_033690 [Lathyrus oleraceus]|uniref:FAM91 N-terminal domain-containing protein n=1 Tax=Pisum sativum TaxID=3888 RepID=A0A9D4XXH7_PEA|nr:hypothetical protein KIW84_033690 [Pisum sativum]